MRSLAYDPQSLSVYAGTSTISEVSAGNLLAINTGQSSLKVQLINLFFFEGSTLKKKKDKSEETQNLRF